MNKLSSSVSRRYQEILQVTDWEIATPYGWSDISHVMKTVPYQVYRVEFFDGLFIEGADTHIVMNSYEEEVFLKDCLPGDLILSKNGISIVSDVFPLKRKEEMFDLDINDHKHIFYTNGIVSHNCVVGETKIIIKDENSEDKEERSISIEELYNNQLLINNDEEEEDSNV